jgi:aminopeptidase N
MMGRLLAAKTLGGKKDSQSVEKLNERLNQDPFHGVRIEAARALAKTRTPEALKFLAGSLKQEDARVRQEVVRGLGKFYDEAAFAALETVVETEKNPEIVSVALEAAGKYPREKVKPVLMAALKRESYKNQIADAAVSAIRVQADDTYIEPLTAHLKAEESNYETHDFGSGLDALAYLARNRDDNEREPVRDFIAGYLNHPKESLRRQAVSALGTLEDRRSIPLLQAIVDTGNKNLTEYKAAEDAIKKLNEGKEQATEVKDLRNEVTELQKQLREMLGKLETLQKQTTPAKAEDTKSAEKNQPEKKAE